MFSWPPNPNPITAGHSESLIHLELDGNWEREQAQEPEWGVNQGENSLNCLHICLHSKRPPLLSSLFSVWVSSLCSGSIPSFKLGSDPSHCLHLDHLAPLFPADSSDLYKVQIIFTSLRLKDNVNTTKLSIYCHNNVWPLCQVYPVPVSWQTSFQCRV